MISPVKPEKIIVEDSNSGYEFFEGLKGDYSVISAGGKSNIFGEILRHPDSCLLVIADGAAFGPEMDRVMKQVKKRKKAVLFLPESFEWLILKSGVIAGGDLQAVLEAPEDYVESSRHFSWERFFTDMLVKLTQDTYMKYSKRKLNMFYLREEISDKIVGQMAHIELK